MVIVNFIRDKEVGMYARAKRLAKGVHVVHKAKESDDDISDSDKSQ